MKTKSPLVKVKTATSRKSSIAKPSKKTKSCLRGFLEFLLFVIWLICTGIGGYFVGHTPTIQDCPPPPEPLVVRKKRDCIPQSKGSGLAAGAVEKKEGFTFDELTRLWKCSQAQSNITQANQRIYPKEKHFDKTKWKSVLSVDPKKFFDKYLTQYPGDTRAVQPVVVFSHRELDNFDQISDVCKVIDVAVVPDTPGICVAVTETFHDVASYHMLHADKQADGTFALTSNSIIGRTLPDEPAYAAARGLLLDYFRFAEAVGKAVKKCPKFGQGRVVVGTMVESLDELSLYRNLLASGYREGVSKNKYCAFTTQSEVNDGLKKLGISVAYLPELQHVGTSAQSGGHPVPVSDTMKRRFLQAWLAFAVANSNSKMMWTSPGTVMFDRPDNIVSSAPVVETLWAYRGRADRRAAPFFVSFDFHVPTGHERPVHLMHEVMMHFDLVLAWDSIDAVASYRLSENNARYGTTTYVLPPYTVLHTDLLAQDPQKIRDAVASPNKPKALVFPREGKSAAETKELMKSTGLWLADEL